MKLIKNMVAKSKSKTLLTKLAVLRSEFEKGNSSKADLEFMDKYLSELSKYSEQVKTIDASIKYYSFYRSMLSSLIYRQSLAKESVPCLAISSVHGDFSDYEEKVEENKKKNDVVVVLGNFIDPNKQDAAKEMIQKMMNEQFTKNVVVLKGKNEVDYLNQIVSQEELNSEEVRYLNLLPIELRTDDFSFLNGELEDDLPLNEIMTNQTHNFTDKLIVYVQKNEESDNLFTSNNDKRIMSLNDHVAVRLDFNPQ